MRPSLGLFAVLSLHLAGCFNFDAAYARYCTLNQCLDAGTGGAAGGGVGGGGGAGGGGGGGGGGTPDSGPPDAGPLDAGSPYCDAGLCFVRSYDTPKIQMWSIWAVSPNEVFAAGLRGTVVHYDGTKFNPTVTPLMNGDLWAVHGAVANNVWAVGTPTSKSNAWDGTAWVPHSNPVGQGSFYGVFGSPNGVDVLGVTSYGEVTRWNGTTWSLAGAAGTQWTFEGIHGCDGDDAWIATDQGSIFRYSSDGGLFVEYTGAIPLNAVYCHPTAGVWVVGNSGLVMVRDPKTEAWSPRSVGVTNALNTVWVSPAGEAWIAGTLRTLLRVEGDAGVVAYNIRPYDLATYTDITGSTDNSIWVTGLYSQNATFDGGVIIQYLSTPP